MDSVFIQSVWDFGPWDVASFLGFGDESMSLGLGDVGFDLRFDDSFFIKDMLGFELGDESLVLLLGDAAFDLILGDSSFIEAGWDFGFGDESLVPGFVESSFVLVFLIEDAASVVGFEDSALGLEDSDNF